MTFRVRLIFLVLLSAVLATSCGSSVCGLALHDRVTVNSSSASLVPCCGGSTFKDVALSGSGDTEFDLASASNPTQPGLVDAFLVPTSCTKLFDGPYPGGSALCQVYVGPAAPGKVTSRAKLAAGTYRVWLQGYTSNTTDAPYSIDVGIWDHSCRSPILQ
jgi:hypothetical protein